VSVSMSFGMALFPYLLSLTVHSEDQRGVNAGRLLNSFVGGARRNLRLKHRDPPAKTSL
jgi:hypothetical protein